MAKTSMRAAAREKRIKRIRKNITGTAQRPRLRVFKSARHIYGQLIDDSAGHTLAAMSTKSKDFQPSEEKGKIALAKQVGLRLAELAKAKGVEEVVFDRGGYIYHGRVKALSDGAREGGLNF
ncbi:50S ribosomal protein L18 [Desulfurivibrio alkaliphilus]|uniref:Large ribosomal subunit protein uL18 n=1 Tax=Desulfurivibrio alkaliphilus (strain DSM 19089 / UNIQEM U267 / AHT2) TaxID=589865 RepID=D6Z3K6_DESAT|nr:50S ribosomal protein L18 [Desulfurivibrio alkaliphilus]ADH86131.1 ribosomal protein L18 [Desulfurivibrio alkaliphilus AHT 2]